MVITYFSIPPRNLHEVAGGSMKNLCEDNQSLAQTLTRYNGAPV